MQQKPLRLSVKTLDEFRYRINIRRYNSGLSFQLGVFASQAGSLRHLFIENPNGRFMLARLAIVALTR